MCVCARPLCSWFDIRKKENFVSSYKEITVKIKIKNNVTVSLTLLMWKNCYVWMILEFFCPGFTFKNHGSFNSVYMVRTFAILLVILD